MVLYQHSLFSIIICQGSLRKVLAGAVVITVRVVQAARRAGRVGRCVGARSVAADRGVSAQGRRVGAVVVRVRLGGAVRRGGAVAAGAA